MRKIVSGGAVLTCLLAVALSDRFLQAQAAAQTENCAGGRFDGDGRIGLGSGLQDVLRLYEPGQRWTQLAQLSHRRLVGQMFASQPRVSTAPIRTQRPTWQRAGAGNQRPRPNFGSI